MAPLLQRRGDRPLTDLFAELAQLMVDSADTLSKVMGHSRRERPRMTPRLHENTLQADAISDRIGNRLADSLITPYEAELLYDLALTMSDIVESMESVGDVLVLGRLGELPPQLLEAAKGIERGCELTVASAWRLRRVRELGDHYSQMRRTTRQGRRLCRQALGTVYGRGGAAGELLPLHDAIRALAEVVEGLERAGRLTDLLRVKDA